MDSSQSSKNFKGINLSGQFCFSPDGKTILVGGEDGCAAIYDISSREEMYSLQKRGPVWSICFSPDGKTIALAGDDGSAVIYDESS